MFRLPFRAASLFSSQARRCVSQSSSSASSAAAEATPLPIEVWRKRLMYHASKRGMRENEVVLGRFAKANLANMSVAQLHLFEEFLEQFDPDVNKWLMRKEPVPKELDNEVRFTPRVASLFRASKVSVGGFLAGF
jgi:antitoxin CptB